MRWYKAEGATALMGSRFEEVEREVLTVIDVYVNVNQNQLIPNSLTQSSAWLDLLFEGHFVGPRQHGTGFFFVRLDFVNGGLQVRPLRL